MELPEIRAVPVPGGELAFGVWRPDAPGTPVLAIHGLTASHRAWVEVAARLVGPVVAPDLRGRGGSGDLPGPYGIARHADDCADVLDVVGAERAVVAGHSMGGFVALVLAARHPDRVERLVLVDGGPPLPELPGADPDAAIEALIGPAVARLRMRFASREQYREFWRKHPAFARWSPAVEAYVDYDLVGEPPELRSPVRYEAVREDSLDQYSAEVRNAWTGLAHEAVLVLAGRGFVDDPVPLYPDPAVAGRVPVRTVPTANHYSILFGEVGASTVASLLRTE